MKCEKGYLFQENWADRKIEPLVPWLSEDEWRRSISPNQD